jgi:hypothetical protein
MKIKIMIVLTIWLLFICLFFWDRITLCSPSWLRTAPAPASRVLELQACATMPGYRVFFSIFLWELRTGLENIVSSLYVCVYVYLYMCIYMCVCVCVCESIQYNIINMCPKAISPSAWGWVGSVGGLNSDKRLLGVAAQVSDPEFTFSKTR